MKISRSPKRVFYTVRKKAHLKDYICRTNNIEGLYYFVVLKIFQDYICNTEDILYFMSMKLLNSNITSLPNYVYTFFFLCFKTFFQINKCQIITIIYCSFYYNTIIGSHSIITFNCPCQGFRLAYFNNKVSANIKYVLNTLKLYNVIEIIYHLYKLL